MRTISKPNLQLCLDDEIPSAQSSLYNHNQLTTCNQKQSQHKNKIFLPYSAQSVTSASQSRKFSNEILQKFTASKVCLDKNKHFTERNNEEIKNAQMNKNDQSTQSKILIAQTHRIELKSSFQNDDVKSTGNSLHIQQKQIQNDNIDQTIRKQKSQGFYQYQKFQLQELISSMHQSIENYKEKLKQYNNETQTKRMKHSSQDKYLKKNYSNNVILQKSLQLQEIKKSEPQSQNVSTMHLNQKNKREEINQNNDLLSQYITKCNPNSPKSNLHHKNEQSLPQDFQLKCTGNKNNATKKPQANTFYYIKKMQLYFSGIQTNSNLSQLYRDHYVATFHSLAFCSITTPPKADVLEQKKIYLPRKPTIYNKTVILDLDETLVHCNESLEVPNDIILPIEFPEGGIIKAGINIRPYSVQLLTQLASLCEVIVFTASHQCYANKVLDHLDPTNKLIHHRLYRDSCMATQEGVHIKDLRILANRDLKNIVLVDNAAYSFGFQINNGIPIIPFYDDPNDTELYQLLDYLKLLFQEDDVRELNKNTFRFEDLSNYDTIEEAIETIFLQ